MFDFRKWFNRFKAKFNLDKMFQVIVISIIILIVLHASAKLYQPIDSREYNNVVVLSDQASYLHTQTMAQALLGQEKIHVFEYLKLMLAQQQEASQVKEYPAMKLEDE
ncbi:hypothetical protein [Acinetobacter pullicarnis]|uniref:hypothetical protein n=1 Tax=Acinetobacter pullicarnis TaxID=2576829 RepID=UPI00111F4A63|nr:hypothetical protein [Acinetobacter pullicarnis]